MSCERLRHVPRDGSKHDLFIRRFQWPNGFTSTCSHTEHLAYKTRERERERERDGEAREAGRDREWRRLASLCVGVVLMAC